MQAASVAQTKQGGDLPRVRALLCHPGTQHSPKLAEQLERLGLLHEYWTTLAVAEFSRLHRTLTPLLRGTPRAALGHRTFRGVSPARVRQIRRLEVKFLLDRWRGIPAEEAYNWKCRAFQDQVAQSSIRAATHVIGFDSASWIVGQRALAAGKPYLLERTAPHPNAHAQAITTVIERHGDGWLGDIKPAAVSEVEHREHHLATRIVVASSFARTTLLEAGVAAERVLVNPFGVDTRKFVPQSRDRAARPLKFLFVGAISALKGMPLLFDAWSNLPADSAELTLAGGAERHVLGRKPTDRNFRYVGKRAHAELPTLMAEHDVFVFPTYFDGFGLVLLEAMACGLPVIASKASAGPDLVTDGVEGFIVPAGDAEALTRRMRHFIDDPECARRMGEAARKRAELFTWEGYGNRWRACLDDVAC